MSYIYNATYYDKKNIFYKRNGLHVSFKTIELKCGIIIGLFQGSKGDKPHLDFIVKQLEPGFKSKVRTPSHTHWIVDLLLKAERQKKLVLAFTQYYIKQYEKLPAFKNKTERVNYALKTVTYARKKFSKMNMIGNYSVGYLSTIIELFIKCEKQTKGAFMFINLLKLVEKYCKGETDFYTIISYSKRV